MKTQRYFPMLAVALVLGGLARAEDATPASVQVTVGKPVINITETKMPSGPVTWLGISSEEAPGDVLAQLPAEQTSGLLVRYVSKDSPADKAGVQINDVLTRLDDQILVNQDQLKVLVSSRRADDAIKLSGYRHGKPFALTAKLESKALTAEEAIKIGTPGSTANEWSSVSSLPIDVQKIIQNIRNRDTKAQPTLPADVQKILGEAMSGTRSLPVSVSARFTVTGPDGKPISSGTFGDPGVISQLLKIPASLLSSGSNAAPAAAK